MAIDLRVICEPEEIPAVMTVLCRTWRVRHVRQLPAADGRERLYVTVDLPTGTRARPGRIEGGRS